MRVAAHPFKRHKSYTYTFNWPFIQAIQSIHPPSQQSTIHSLIPLVAWSSIKCKNVHFVFQSQQNNILTNKRANDLHYKTWKKVIFCKDFELNLAPSFALWSRTKAKHFACWQTQEQKNDQQSHTIIHIEIARKVQTIGNQTPPNSSPSRHWWTATKSGGPPHSFVSE